MYPDVNGVNGLISDIVMYCLNNFVLQSFSFFFFPMDQVKYVLFTMLNFLPSVTVVKLARGIA